MSDISNIQLYNCLICPLTGQKLNINIISVENIGTESAPFEFIHTGYLFSDQNTFYPIIEGVPRLLPNSFIEHKMFFEDILPNVNEILKNFYATFSRSLNDFEKKSFSTQKSFTKEWSYLKDEDKIWNHSYDDHKIQVFKELDISDAELKGKLVADIGCGHGRCSNFFNAAGADVIAIDLTSKIVEVSKANRKKNLLFVQADIQYLPISKNTFSFIYSSGVLHHTFSTYQSFLKIQKLLNSNGKICLFLYHPRKNFIHNIMRMLRTVTKILPIAFQYFIYRYIFYPIVWVLSKLLNKKIIRSEVMVNLTDFFSPQYRWEHSENEVIQWFVNEGYGNIKITTQDTFGFSIIAKSL